MLIFSNFRLRHHIRNLGFLDFSTPGFKNLGPMFPSLKLYYSDFSLEILCAINRGRPRSTTVVWKRPKMIKDLLTIIEKKFKILLVRNCCIRFYYIKPNMYMLKRLHLGAFWTMRGFRDSSILFIDFIIFIYYFYRLNFWNIHYNFLKKIYKNI